MTSPPRASLPADGSSLLLAIDIGNSHITLGVFSGDALLCTFRVQSRLAQTADEYALALRQLLALEALPTERLGQAVLVSVVPRLTPLLVAAVRRAFRCDALVVGPATDLGLVLAVDRPNEVGADRLVNVVAVRQQALDAAGLAGGAGLDVGMGAVVVDLGTATTFDCVSPTGEFVGGVIAPGMATSFESLVGRTAQLFDVDLSAPARALGKNTADCLRSGIVYGYAGLVDGLVARLSAELPFACRIVATGGFATTLAPHSRSIETVEPDLTLRGLRAIHRRVSALGR